MFAQPTRIAVANNFALPLKNLLAESANACAALHGKSACQFTLSSGSTGKLYAQIINGAPFDIFFAADQHRPKLLLRHNPLYKLKTYTRGQIVLAGFQSVPSATSLGDEQGRIAIANPKLAPYGQAAIEFLQHQRLFNRLSNQLVYADNVGAAAAMLNSGSVNLAIIAKAQLLPNQAFWQIPATTHQPILQDVVLLTPNNVGAKYLFHYLSTQQATQTLKRYGYLEAP